MLDGAFDSDSRENEPFGAKKSDGVFPQSKDSRQANHRSSNRRSNALIDSSSVPTQEIVVDSCNIPGLDEDPSIEIGSNLRSTINDMQLIYDMQRDQFLSIHDVEENIKQDDGTTYIDTNFDKRVEFKLISSTRSAQPWAGFWHSKHSVNSNLLRAVTKG